MRAAIISDIHANSFALQKVLVHAFHKMKCDRLFCLGDLLGYGATPIETLGLLSEYLEVCTCICGNHEDIIWRLGSFFADETGSLCSPEHVEEFHASYKAISSRAISSCLSNLDELRQNADAPGVAWYFSLIENRDPYLILDQKEFERPIVLSHGSYKDRDIFYHYGWTNEFGANNFHINPILELKLPGPVTFVGHTHIPMLYSVVQDWKDRERGDFQYGKPYALGDSLQVINPGSVGFSRDGDSRASYAVIDTDPWTVTFFRLDYDSDLASDAMINKQFDMESIKIFMTSVYPNELSNGLATGEINLKYQAELEERKESAGE